MHIISKSLPLNIGLYYLQYFAKIVFISRKLWQVAIIKTYDYDTETTVKRKVDKILHFLFLCLSYIITLWTVFKAEIKGKEVGMK